MSAKGNFRLFPRPYEPISGDWGLLREAEAYLVRDEIASAPGPFDYSKAWPISTTSAGPITIGMRNVAAAKNEIGATIPALAWSRLWAGTVIARNARCGPPLRILHPDIAL